MWYFQKMKIFRYIQDVDAWLEPMDYIAFWYAVEPFNLVLQPRDHCDEQIENGAAEKDDVLAVLKYMARDEISAMQGLKRKPVTPWLQLVESH